MGAVSGMMAITGSLSADAVYTFELWGAGGGGGGPVSGATSDTEHSGPGGGGAYVAGTLVNLTADTTLQLLAGGAGLGGSTGANGVASSGAGGGASAIRLADASSTVIAVAGGGGGGGGSGSGAAADATGGRGGNSVDGTGVYATNVNNVDGGAGGQSGNAEAAGDGPDIDNLTNPPAKTDSLQNGGDGRQKDQNIVGNGQSATPHPSGWGGAGGDGAFTTGNEGGGGAGGGGWFGGSGGDGAEGGSESGAGGGGGGSYRNATYVSDAVSAEGSFEVETAHQALAVTQPSLGTQTATPTGKGGDGAGGPSFGLVDGSDGEPGGVFIYKNGILVASVTTSAGTATYTI